MKWWDMARSTAEQASNGASIEIQRRAVERVADANAWDKATGPTPVSRPLGPPAARGGPTLQDGAPRCADLSELTLEEQVVELDERVRGGVGPMSGQWPVPGDRSGTPPGRFRSPMIRAGGLPTHLVTRLS